MPKILKLINLIRNIMKWAPLLVKIANVEADKDNPDSPVTENDFQGVVLDGVISKLNIKNDKVYVVDRKEI